MINECKMVELPKICDPRGNLSFIQSNDQIPFDIKRIYYLYDVPGGAYRGSHAHKKLQQFIIAVSGSFDVALDDGKEKKRFHLNRSHSGLYVPPMMWGNLDNFSSGAVCLVLASEVYQEADYIRSYDIFLNSVANEK
jgi:dTDP-4-dehydrorhamnose 3,5-epimerase-like enzyme